MKAPTKRFLGMTWLGWVNFVIFQWLFLRLCYNVDTTNTKLVGWGFVVGPAPLTGWTFSPIFSNSFLKNYWPFYKIIILYGQTGGKKLHAPRNQNSAEVVKMIKDQKQNSGNL